MTGRCTARYSRALCCVLGSKCGSRIRAARILEPHRAALLTSWLGVLDRRWSVLWLRASLSRRKACAAWLRPSTPWALSR